MSNILHFFSLTWILPARQRYKPSCRLLILWTSFFNTFVNTWGQCTTTLNLIRAHFWGGGCILWDIGAISVWVSKLWALLWWFKYFVKFFMPYLDTKSLWSLSGWGECFGMCCFSKLLRSVGWNPVSTAVLFIGV